MCDVFKCFCEFRKHCGLVQCCSMNVENTVIKMPKQKPHPVGYDYSRGGLTLALDSHCISSR